MATTHWDNFPPTYRPKEMAILARWIGAGESGSVVGLPGCGRSNLLGFLCHRPEALKRYLPDKADPVALIPVDLNHLPSNDVSTVYRLILRSFYWLRDRLDPELQIIVAGLYQENRAAQDPFLAQSALYELLFAFQARQTRVVLVLNRFDSFCQATTPQVINTLRGLRDSFRETLCFIVGMIQEAAYLPNPEALGFFYELLSFEGHICWVGAMDGADAKWVISQHTGIDLILPANVEIETMLALTGGFPILLKAVSHWWLSTTERPRASEWPDILSRRRNFDYYLARLWNALTQEEQFALAAVSEWQERVVEENENSSTLEETREWLNKDYQYTLRRLETKGMCHQTDLGWQILGELLTDYVKRVGPSSKGRLWIDEQTEVIYQGLTSLQPQLAPNEEKLLRFLINHPYKRHTYDDLLDIIYEGSDRYERGPNDIQVLVKDLRRKIEVKPSEPRYIINIQRFGYQLYPEGRPH